MLHVKVQEQQPSLKN